MCSRQKYHCVTTNCSLKKVTVAELVCKNSARARVITKLCKKQTAHVRMGGGVRRPWVRRCLTRLESEIRARCHRQWCVRENRCLEWWRGGRCSQAVPFPGVDAQAGAGAENGDHDAQYQGQRVSGVHAGRTDR